MNKEVENEERTEERAEEREEKPEKKRIKKSNMNEIPCGVFQYSTGEELHQPGGKSGSRGSSFICMLKT